MCLRSLASQKLPQANYEIVVVNDGGRPLPELGTDADSTLKYLEQPNGGPAMARNNGACQSSGSILAFLDDDCTAHEDWLQSLLSVYDRHPDAGGVAGSLVIGRNASAIGYWEMQEFIPLFGKLNAEFGTSYYREGRVWYHFGCNCSYRREVFLEAGGYDERLRFMEDTDLQWRLCENRIPVYYTPAAVVEHNCQRALIGELRRCYRGGSAYRTFCRLHPGYRKLVAKTSNSPQSLAKSLLQSMVRASGYARSPHMKSYFAALAFLHRCMYAAGYMLGPQSAGSGAGIAQTASRSAQTTKKEL